MKTSELTDIGFDYVSPGMGYYGGYTYSIKKGDYVRVIEIGKVMTNKINEWRFYVNVWKNHWRMGDKEGNRQVIARFHYKGYDEIPLIFLQKLILKYEKLHN